MQDIKITAMYIHTLGEKRYGGGLPQPQTKKRIEAFVQRGVRLGLYLANDPTPTELASCRR